MSILRDTYQEIIQTQLSLNDPPSTSETYQFLIENGVSEERALQRFPIIWEGLFQKL